MTEISEGLAVELEPAWRADGLEPADVIYAAPRK